MKEAGIVGAWALGILLGPSLYLYFAAGNGIVSLHAPDPSFMISFAALPLVFLSPNLENRVTVFAIFVGFLICITELFFLFLTAFVLGFPGSDWASAGSAIPFFPAFLGMYYVFRNFMLIPHILLSFLLSFPITIWMVKDYQTRKIDRQIQRTINGGGCVLLNLNRGSHAKPQPWTVRAASEIPFGLFIGHASPRIYFVTKDQMSDWSYSQSKTQNSRQSTIECPDVER